MRSPTFAPNMAGWAFPWRNRGSALQTNRPRRAPSYEVAATKKNPKQIKHLGFGSLLPQSGFFAGRRVSGDGVPPARPDTGRHLAARRTYSNAATARGPSVPPPGPHPRKDAILSLLVDGHGAQRVDPWKRFRSSSIDVRSRAYRQHVDCLCERLPGARPGHQV
jgi:hypothetical protein